MCLSYAGWTSTQSAKQSKDIAESFSDRQDGLETGNTDAMQIDDSQLSPARKNMSAVGAFDLAQYSALLHSTAALVAEADDIMTPTGACLSVHIHLPS